MWNGTRYAGYLAIVGTALANPEGQSAMQARAAQAGRQARWGLKGKLILSMLLVGVVPLHGQGKGSSFRVELPKA